MTPPPIKTLLIEDNPRDARLLQEDLGQSTYPVFDLQHAQRLDQALARLIKESFDLVLLDLNLPDRAGLKTLTVAHGQAPGAAIVIMTGLQDEAQGVKAVQQGAQDYLVKGQMDANLLVRSLRHAYERKRVEMELHRARDEAAVASQA